MKKVVVLLLVVLLVSAVQATTVSLGSDADNWVRDGSADNYGADGEMYLVGGVGRCGYIRFDISAYNAADITDATLTLTKVTAPWGRSDTLVTGRLGVVGLDNVAGNTAQNWDELVLSSTNVGAEFLGGAGGAQPIDLTVATDLDMENGANVTESTDGVTFTLTGPDLVAFLQTRANDDGLVTLIATFTSTDSRGFWLGAKENADPTAVPVLSLTVPEPATMVLLGLGSLLAVRRKR